MNKHFFSFFMITSALAGSLIGQEYALLESSLPNESLIKQICLSDLTSYPGVCADCDTIAKVFELNQRAGLTDSKLQKNDQKKTPLLFFSGAKMLRRKQLKNRFDRLETKSNDLAPEYSASILRLLSCVEVDKSDFDGLLAYETELLHQGLVNAATNVSVQDSDNE